MPEKCTKVPTEQAAELLAGFESGLTADEREEVIPLFEQYLFYAPVKGGRRYLCTSCGDMWESHGKSDALNRRKHNDADYCPRCKAPVTIKAVGRLGRGERYPSLHEEHNLVMFRAAEDGALQISAGRIVADYERGVCDWDGWTDEAEICWPVPTLAFWERRRYYLRPGMLLSWKRNEGEYMSGWGRGYYRTQWERTVSAGEPNPRDSIMSRQPDGGGYYVLGWDALGRTDLRYSAVERYFNRERYALFRGVVSYLARYSRHQQMEMLVKLGFEQVIDRMLDQDNMQGRLINWRAKTPWALFRLSKPAYKAWAEAGAKLDLLPIVQRTRDHRQAVQLLATQAARSIAAKRLASVIEAARKYDLKLLHLLNYLNDNQRAGTWMDYLNMAEQLKLDLSRENVLLPKNLIERHDAAAEQIEYAKNTAAQKKYRRIYRQLEKRYAMEAVGYLIRVPKTGASIINEGRALQHCVGGYAARHMDGRCTILFLRRAEEPDKPLCTIEMNGASIVQIHGFRNDRCSEKPEVLYKTFLDIWLLWLKAGSPRDQQGRPVLERKQKEVKTA